MMETNVLRWSALEKLLFRFSFIFLVLFILLFNNGAFPFIMPLMYYPIDLLHIFIPWFGEVLLHLPNKITVFSNGSGDTTYDYVLLLFAFLVTIPATLIWSLFDRKSTDYNKLYYWLTVAVRFFVGMMIVHYGAIKVNQLQFPYPGLYRLTETYGESSPMRLAWTFFGYSKGYNLFMGIAELMAGLLLFRRTVTIGALITLGTSANIMAVNYFYDVPVKILTTALVTLCLFLLLPNFTRLFRLFFKGESVSLKIIPVPVIRFKWMYYVKYSFKYLTILFVVFTLAMTVFYAKTNGKSAYSKLPLYGVYDVNTFTVNGKVIPADTLNNNRWKQLLIAKDNYAEVKFTGNRNGQSDIRIDTIARKISGTFKDDPRNKYAFTYTKVDSVRLILKGKIHRDTVTIELIKKRFLLTERGFNWVNEHPFNR